jgi:hypothetical protein
VINRDGDLAKCSLALSMQLQLPLEEGLGDAARLHEYRSLNKAEMGEGIALIHVDIVGVVPCAAVNLSEM